MSEVKFSLGGIFMTPGAKEALVAARELPSTFLHRHVAGDWGDVSQGDKELNDEALTNGGRVLSAYTTLLGTKLWVITEAEGDNGQREATTILLPDEY